MHGKKSFHHRNHRTGWFIPGGTSPPQRVRCAWPRTAVLHVQHEQDRWDICRSPRTRCPSLPPLWGSRRFGADLEYYLQYRPGRDISPRRAEPCQGEFRYARVHRERDCAGDYQDPRGGQEEQPWREVLPGFLKRDVRVRGASPERAHGLLSAQSLCLRETLCLLDGQELPGGVRDIRLQRHPL